MELRCLPFGAARIPHSTSSSGSARPSRASRRTGPTGPCSPRPRPDCPDCIPAFKADRTATLVSAAQSVLAEMRDSESDPAQTIEAKAKRVAAYVERKERARAWLHENPGPHDPSAFRSEILPGLASVTLPQMMRAPGLASGYCWKIRRGERIPHPMYWSDLRRLTEAQPEAGPRHQ